MNTSPCPQRDVFASYLSDGFLLPCMNTVWYAKEALFACIYLCRVHVYAEATADMRLSQLCFVYL